MNNKFKIKTILLTLGLLVLFSGTSINYSQASGFEKNISSKNAYELIEKNNRNKDFIVLDIRTKGEFTDGHIKGAVNIDYYSPDFQTKLNNLDKNKTYLFHCKSGGRSGRAVSIFKDLNFKKIIHLNRGFDEWKASSFPIER